MLAQMAATVGSTAAGVTIGHGLSNMLFGGSSSAPVPEQQAPVAQQTQAAGVSCEVQAKRAHAFHVLAPDFLISLALHYRISERERRV